MKITVGTFNLNNLFSRFNFKSNIENIKGGTEIVYSFDEHYQYKIRTFKGKLVKAKSVNKSQEIASRINRLDLDILCVQEVEDIGVLKDFNAEMLDGRYPYVVLVEGNDDRLIDVGLLSKYPVGPITSWKEARSDEWEINEPIFGRDLIQVEILNQSRNKKLFTIFNTHLKSNFVPFDSSDPIAEAALNNKRRKVQSKTIAEIIKSVTRPNSNFILTGDMNDTPDSEYVAPIALDSELNVSNALINMQEIGEMNRTKYPPDTILWTHRFSPGSGIYEYHLFDHIWISNSLKDNLTGAFVDRRKKVGGDGSDHDPVWIELDI